MHMKLNPTYRIFIKKVVLWLSVFNHLFNNRYMKNYITHSILTLFLLLISFSQNFAQQKVSIKGTVERIKVHGKLLEGNLSGDSADRYVSVYLPASYNGT